MTTRARTNKKTNLRLESLEAREAPTVGIAGAWQAALAQAQAHSPNGFAYQRMQHPLQIARPGSNFQRLAPSATFNNVNGSMGRAPFNPSVALAQHRRAAMNAATPAPRAAMFNRPAFQIARAIRSPLRTIRTFSPPSAPITPMTPTNPPNLNPTADAGTPIPTLPPNVSGALNAIYQQSNQGSDVPVISTGPGSIVIDGTNVGVSVHGNGQGSFSDFVGSLQNLGMQVNASSDVTWTVTGMLPIAQLPTAAQMPQTRSITPMYRPFTAFRS